MGVENEELSGCRQEQVGRAVSALLDAFRLGMIMDHWTNVTERDGREKGVCFLAFFLQVTSQ